jgi:hypothetical protein
MLLVLGSAASVPDQTLFIIYALSKYHQDVSLSHHFRVPVTDEGQLTRMWAMCQLNLMKYS